MKKKLKHIKRKKESASSDMNVRVRPSLRKVTCVLSVISVCLNYLKGNAGMLACKQEKNKMVKLCATEIRNWETFMPTHSSDGPLQ